MLESQDKEKLLQKVIARSGKNKEQVLHLVEEKKNKFAGLLTDNGALYMLAKEFDVDLELSKTLTEKIKLSQIEAGMQNLELLVRIVHIFSPKKYEKEGKKGSYCKLIVADETGEIKLTLWNKSVEKLSEEKVQRNDLILLKNCFVTEFNGVKQLSMGKGSELSTNPSYTSTVKIPISKVETKKLKELLPEENEIDVIARFIKAYPKKEFENKGEKRAVMNFEIADASTNLRATAWNELIEEITKLSPGEIIKIEGAYTKQGMNAIELHLGWKSRILRNVKPLEPIPEISEVIFHQNSEQTAIKNISELAEKDKFIELNAMVSAINKSNFFFTICPNCQRKAEKVGEKFVCNKCGELKEPDIMAVLSVNLSDSSGEIRAISFSESALQLMQLSKEEFKKKIKAQPVEELIDEFKTNLTQKYVKVSGYVKKNTISTELEFVIKNVEYRGIV
ncbi:MAG: hypothetical protein Q7S21_03070 [archaeon]|nr:hypothetical protein [archaeon]